MRNNRDGFDLICFAMIPHGLGKETELDVLVGRKGTELDNTGKSKSIRLFGCGDVGMIRLLGRTGKEVEWLDSVIRYQPTK